MRSLYITIERTTGKSHTFREVPSRLLIEPNETVTKVVESTFRVVDMVSPETAVRMEIFKRSLSGVKTHA